MSLQWKFEPFPASRSEDIVEMAKTWPKHGPNMVLLIGNNIDMFLGPIILNPESFINLVWLES